MNAPDHKFWGLMALILLCCAGIWAVRQPAARTPLMAGEALLAGVPAPEMPTVAVRRLQGVSPARRLAMMSQMMLELAESQPAVAPYFIASVSRQFPEAAPWLLVEALGQQPDQTVACVHAACVAVPDQTETLVAECVKNLPESFPLVALAAARQRPEDAEAILQAIGKALPEARPALELAMSRQRKYPVEVWEVLRETERLITHSEGVFGPGETVSDRQSSVAAEAVGPARCKVGQAPFAALQNLARARLERQRQQLLYEAGTNGSGSVQTGRTAAFTKAVGPVSTKALGGDTIPEAGSRAGVP